MYLVTLPSPFQAGQDFREQSAWGGPGAMLYLSGIREWGCKGRARSPGAARARGTRAADVRRLLK